MAYLQQFISLLVAFIFGSVASFIALSYSGDIMSTLVHRDMVNKTVTMEARDDVRALHPGEDSHMHNGR